jgi:hypothetical protein
MRVAQIKVGKWYRIRTNSGEWTGLCMRRVGSLAEFKAPGHPVARLMLIGRDVLGETDAPAGGAPEDV